MGAKTPQDFFEMVDSSFPGFSEIYLRASKQSMWRKMIWFPLEQC